MAREEKAKVKMTVIHFETESDNATLQENVRAIAHTLSRALASPQRIVPTPAQLTSNNEQTIDQAGDIDDQSGIDEGNVLSSSPSFKKKSAARQYRIPQPLELDLVSGDPPLKNFLEQKQPDGDVKRYSRLHIGSNSIETFKKLRWTISIRATDIWVRDGRCPRTREPRSAP